MFFLKLLISLATSSRSNSMLGIEESGELPPRKGTQDLH